MAEPATPMVDFEEHGRIVLGRVHSHSILSTANVSEFGQEVLSWVESRSQINLLLDFSDVDYLSSVVLTELLKIKKAIDAQEGNLRLCGISSTIQEIFEITNLDKNFVIHSDGPDKDLPRFERSLALQEQSASWEEPHA